MLRGLEIFWLIITILTAIFMLYEVFTASTRDILITLGVVLLAGFKYYIRRKQRISMEKDDNKSGL